MCAPGLAWLLGWHSFWKCTETVTHEWQLFRKWSLGLTCAGTLTSGSVLSPPCVVCGGLPWEQVWFLSGRWTKGSFARGPNRKQSWRTSSIVLQSRNQNRESRMKIKELSSLWTWKVFFWWSRWCWYIEMEAAISAIKSILVISWGSSGVRSDYSHSSVFLGLPSTWMQGKGKQMRISAGATYQNYMSELQWGQG